MGFMDKLTGRTKEERHAGRQAYLDRQPAKAGPTTERRLIRHYKDEVSYLKDAEEMERRGYVAENTTEKDGKFNVGRTVGKAVVFLPWALLRPSRQGDSVTVTWIRE